MVTGVATAVLMVAAALGAGTAALAAARVLNRLEPAERLALGFAVGSGILGWLTFFPAGLHWLDGFTLVAMVVACLPGWRWALPAMRALRWEAPDGVGKILLAVLGVVLFLDLTEALAPPVDADSLAYHFALPKSFLAAGGLEPVYRANDGLTPLLQHMAYLLALALGGETAMTLWTMVTGWALAGCVFVIARRHLSFNYSLAVTLVLLTTPAVIYGAGSGQVEVRNGMLTVAAAAFVAHALETGRPGFVALAGLAAGFFAGSKYTGLLLVVACGIFILLQRRWFRSGAVFGIFCILAGGQWYLWNWWVTGDPIFPVLYGVVRYWENVPWNDQIHAYYLSALDERVVPANLFWLLVYPFKATLAPEPLFQSLRIGFGPVLLVLLPFSVVAVWHCGRRAWLGPLALYAGISLAVYVLWFFFGPSQRVRHLLPVYPLALMATAVAAERSARYIAAAGPPLTGALAAIIATQLAGAVFFSITYVERLINGEPRDSFLQRNISLYDAVPWINRNLKMTDRLLLTDRQLNYFIDVPVFYGLSYTQAMIEMHPAAQSARKFWSQLREQGITHVLVAATTPGQRSADQVGRFVGPLIDNGCMRVQKTFDLRGIGSRTLQYAAPTSRQIVALAQSCTFPSEARDGSGSIQR